MRALLDVNLLIALFDADHVHHERAHAWFEDNQAHGWASCPLTENGLVRILCHPNYSRTMQRSAAEVIADLHEAARQTDHRFWPDDVSLRDDHRIRIHRIQGPRQITDLYLLALAVRYSGRLVTFDAEPPRVLRRLLTLRRWSHDEQEDHTEVFTRSPRTRSPHGAGAPRRVSIVMGRH